MADSKETEQHQSDAPSLPSWLDKELIQQAVRNAGEDHSEVAEMSVTRASAVGDNYGSTIYRAKVTLTSGKENFFIIKGPALGAAISSLTSGLFQRETVMLADVIPSMQALLEEAAPGRFPPLAASCYHHGTSPVEFIVVEDLATLGFKTADRKRGLGLRHNLLAMRTLARFHAASYALLQRQPGLAEKLTNTWRAMFGPIKVFLMGEFSATAEACRSWPGFEEYADRLERFKQIAMDTFAALNDPKPGAFNVITHGDFWMSNMMFQYEDGVPKDHRAVDLQISHFASPAVDIVYLFASSLSDNVHEHYQDLLIREYHFELKETMELLGLQAPSLEALLSDIDAHGPLSLQVALSQPIIKAERGVNIEALFTGDHSSLVPLLDTPSVKQWMQRVLRDYARRGWLPA